MMLHNCMKSLSVLKSNMLVEQNQINNEFPEFEFKIIFLTIYWSVATWSVDGCWCDAPAHHQFYWTQHKTKMRWILTSRLISIDQVEQQSVVPKMDCDQTVLLHFNLVLKMSGSSEHNAATRLQKNASAFLQNHVRNNVNVVLCFWLKKHSVNINLSHFVFSLKRTMLKYQFNFEHR